ncbi:hypothetical protein TR13x_03080 [Caloranaerobacter sp. TR13]|uniref:hypothetical protein n=1 Tax=Caloranaerobacter sp. TR13 TaxID=1302151 RepID=UPI0006D3EEF9|nr:hypothetical protein [Caloranaerobacter sp. TR13]KPU28334.1 hypothetical protein TR13x_03080 [Caloranaerobacter sp. TR13]
MEPARSKKIIWLEIFLIVAILVIINKNYLFPNKHSNVLSNLILKNCADKQFDKLLIMKESGYRIVSIRKDNDIKKINKIIAYFDNFKLLNYNKRIPNNYSDTSYTIRLENSKTYESLTIRILNSEFLTISLETIVKEKKKPSLTIYKTIHNYNKYKITDKKIDLKYIDTIFNSLAYEIK